MLTFDVRLTLRLTKGDRSMSDEWIETAAKRIKQAEEDKKRRESFELMRAGKISARGLGMFGELQEVLKAAVQKLNEHFPDKEKRLTVEGIRHNAITIHGSRSEASLELNYDADVDELNYDLSKGTGSNEGKIRFGFNEDGEVRFMMNDRPFSIEKLAEKLLEELLAVN
jgi:hypothetical protein